MLRSECCLQIGVIGINHKSAPLEFREKIARGSATLAGQKALFFPHPVVLLSTCNRTEIYFGGSDLAAIHSDLLEWLRGYIHEPFEHRLYAYFGMDCFTHLCHVAAGLDSAIWAETEIQSQVKLAYSSACQWLSLPSCMHYVFQKSLKISKFVRSQTNLRRHCPSLFQAVWHLASEHLGSLPNRSVLLVGYSEINRAMIHFLQRRNVRELTLITKCPSEVVLDGCQAVGYEVIDRWIEYDWIICASAQDQFLIQGQSSGRHLIFDLSVPRNVDPKIATDAIVLYNIEQINAWIEERKSEYSQQVYLSQDLISQETIRLARIYRRKTTGVALC